MRASKLRHLNSLRFGRALPLHKKIKIPLGRVGVKKFEEQRYEHHKRLQEDFFAVYHIEALRPYRVKRGDNFWSICRDRFGIPMWLVKRCNPEVDFTDLRFNQKIVVPIVGE